MKKITNLMLSIAASLIMANGQNLITNSGFESDASTFTVTESSLNVLRRVATHQDATTQTAAPTTTAVPVESGIWVKKGSNTSAVKGVVVGSDYHTGLNCLNLKIGSGTTGAYTNYYQCVAQQKISTSLNSSRTYTVSFWAKVDATSNNQCDSVFSFITDNTLKKNYVIGVALTGGTSWTQYSVTFDLPIFVQTNTTANFSTAFFGVGITTTFDNQATPKTLYSGILLDDFSMVENTPSNIPEAKENAQLVSVYANGVSSLVDGKIEVLSMHGKLISSKSVAVGQQIGLESGAYIIRLKTTEGTFVQKVIL